MHTKVLNDGIENTVTPIHIGHVNIGEGVKELIIIFRRTRHSNSFAATIISEVEFFATAYLSGLVLVDDIGSLSVC